MGRLLKLVGIVAGALVALLIAAAVVVGFLFDPNDYKQEITTAVSTATGRDLVIEGDLEFRIFPSLRIAVGPASLSNAQGFTAANFASIDGASLRVALLPLLGGRVAVAEARLDGLELNLERDASGRNNWQDLAGEESAAAAGPAADTSAGGSAADLDLGIDNITIANANVSWRDRNTGTDWLLTNFGMQADGFGLGTEFPLEIEFEFSGPEIEVAVDTTMDAVLDIASNTYTLNDLSVAIDGSGAAWPGGAGEANVSFSSFTANLDRQSLALDNLVLEILGLEIGGTLRGEQLFDNLTLTGGIEIAEFDPNDVLAVFDTAIETADDGVFRRASASADFIYDSTQMGMRNTRISLDDSTLTGSVGLARDVLRFDLDVDSINIDRYLPPATDEPGAEPDEGSIDEVDLPLDPLRQFAANGSLSLGTTQFMGLTMTNANFDLTVNDGRLRLVPTATLYGGSLSGAVDIVVTSDSAATFSLEQRLAGVDLNGLAIDYLDTDALSGTGNVNLDLDSQGSNLGAIRRALTGNVSFALTDGAWVGIDAWYTLRRALATLQRRSVDAADDTGATTFSRISASGVVADGVLTTNDLNATLPFMALNGNGTVGVFDTEINLRATASLVDGPTLQSDPAMAEYAGAQLPLTVSGTLDDLSILPDFGAIVRAQIQSAVQERVDEERTEVQERIDEQREEVQEEVRDSVRDRLRGLFDR